MAGAGRLGAHLHKLGSDQSHWGADGSQRTLRSSTAHMQPVGHRRRWRSTWPKPAHRRLTPMSPPRHFSTSPA
eukprot:1159068-Pelagomonas_calceolata.AAC.15